MDRAVRVDCQQPGDPLAQGPGCHGRSDEADRDDRAIQRPPRRTAEAGSQHLGACQVEGAEQAYEPAQKARQDLGRECLPPLADCGVGKQNERKRGQADNKSA